MVKKSNDIVRFSISKISLALTVGGIILICVFGFLTYIYLPGFIEGKFPMVLPLNSSFENSSPFNESINSTDSSTGKLTNSTDSFGSSSSDLDTNEGSSIEGSEDEESGDIIDSLNCTNLCFDDGVNYGYRSYNFGSDCVEEAEYYLAANTTDGCCCGNNLEEEDSVNYYCEWSWPQKIINQDTSEVLWDCSLETPYCKPTTTECCKYAQDVYYDCVDMYVSGEEVDCSYSCVDLGYANGSLVPACSLCSDDGYVCKIFFDTSCCCEESEEVLCDEIGETPTGYTETVTHGGFSGSSDYLTKTPTDIISVAQGSTTYSEGIDYILSGDTLDWFPPGNEPSPSSSYEVEYYICEINI